MLSQNLLGDLFRFDVRTGPLKMRSRVFLDGAVAVLTVTAGTRFRLFTARDQHASIILLPRDVQCRVAREEVGWFDMNLMNLNGPIYIKEQLARL